MTSRQARYIRSAYTDVGLVRVRTGVDALGGEEVLDLVHEEPIDLPLAQPARQAIGRYFQLPPDPSNSPSEGRPPSGSWPDRPTAPCLPVISIAPSPSRFSDHVPSGGHTQSCI